MSEHYTRTNRQGGGKRPKRGFKSEAAAQSTIDEMAARYPGLLVRAYRCSCGLWHVGRVPTGSAS